MRNKRLSLRWKLVAVAVVVPVLLWVVAHSRRKASVEVLRTVRVERGDITVTITATGEVKPQNRVEIKPTISGRIEEVLVREGDAVRVGQVLAWMSSTERAAILDAARSQGGDAFERWKNAYKPAPLMAPLDGTVIVRAAEPGQTLTTSEAVVVIADRLIVEAMVDETDLALIKLGQEAEVRLDAYPDRVVPATVDHISYESKLVNNVNVYIVDILPEKVPPTFRSGMTATVTFTVSEREDILKVPSEAITGRPRGGGKRGGEFAVYRKSSTGTPVPTPVRIGVSDGRMTEILEGLEEGEEILVVRRREASTGTNPFSPFGGRGTRRRGGR